jgi:hypothetical protein
MNVGRRQLRTEWTKVIYEPKGTGQDWSLILPFPNTYRNAFEAMCETAVFPHVAASGRLCLFLKGIDSESGPPQEVHDWIAKVGRYVAMKDMLALSFALDYEREAGNPDLPQTSIGTLRARAKPYGLGQPTADTLIASGQLVDKCCDFLNEMNCYETADCVVAAPPSDPAKTYNLPRQVVAGIAEKWGREDLTARVRTTEARPSIKGIPLAQKLETLLGTIEVDNSVFSDKRVLLVDDLYQSGMSMNYCALLLLRAGAKKVWPSV